MRKLFYILFIFCISNSFAQGFRFSYSTYGLGSNRGQTPELVVTISDTLLTYLVFEKTGLYTVSNNAFDDTKYSDTSWTRKRVAHDVAFRKGSKDSILQILKGKEGQYIFCSNPYIMSGGIQQMYFEYKDWCIEYSMKNTFDSTAMYVAKIVNSYLPKDNDIYIEEDWWKDRSDAPWIESCPSKSDKSYYDILVNEGELLRQNSKKKQK